MVIRLNTKDTKNMRPLNLSKIVCIKGIKYLEKILGFA